MFNITEEESRQMVEEFYRSPEFVQLQPIRHSQVGIVRLRGQSKKLYAVTGRQDSAREKTELWLDQHFPGMFDDLIITNSYTEHEIKKVDVCKSLALNLIIDDNIDTCIECAQSGIRARNFVGHEEVYPWCERTGMSMYGWK